MNTFAVCKPVCKALLRSVTLAEAAHRHCTLKGYGPFLISTTWFITCLPPKASLLSVYSTKVVYLKDYNIERGNIIYIHNYVNSPQV